MQATHSGTTTVHTATPETPPSHLVEHAPQDLGRHNEARRVRIDLDVPGQQPHLRRGRMKGALTSIQQPFAQHLAHPPRTSNDS